MAVHIKTGIKTQRLNNCLIVYNAHKQDLIIAGIQHLLLVFIVFGIIFPQHNQAHASSLNSIRPDNFKNRIFRFRPGNEENKFTGFKMKLLKIGCIGRKYHGCRIRNHCYLFLRYKSCKMILNFRVVCHQVVPQQ